MKIKIKKDQTITIHFQQHRESDLVNTKERETPSDSQSQPQRGRESIGEEGGEKVGIGEDREFLSLERKGE